MTFAAFEGSAQGGHPVELYSLALGAETFRWTSAEDDYVFGGNTFEAAEISRTRVLISSEERQDLLTVNLPASDPYVRKYIKNVPGKRGTLTVQRVHRFDPDQEAFVLFKGIVQAVAFSSDGVKASIAVRPLTTGLSQTIPRMTYQNLCNHFLYDERCKVLQSLFQFTAVVSAVTGSTITVPGLSVNGADWAVAGFVQIPSGDFRLVLSQTGNDVRLLLPFSEGVLNVQVDVFAGCAHTIAVCKTKFNNVINYGGFAFVPLKNIFETGLA